MTCEIRTDPVQVGEQAVAATDRKIVIAAAVIDEREVGTFDKGRKTGADIDKVDSPNGAAATRSRERGSVQALLTYRSGRRAG